MIPPIKFEDKIDIINNLIERYRSHWTLYAISWMDYNDVAQDLRIHIFKKWDQWRQNEPLEPWVSRIIHNQVVNKFRDYYTSIVRPCIQNRGCAFRDGDLGCLYTASKTQCSECPLYAKWEKNKQQAFNIKLPVSIVHHEQEVENMPCDFVDLEKYYLAINGKVEGYLTKIEYKIYKKLYIEHKTEEEVAVELGLKTNEKNRKAGYRQIMNYKKRIMEKIKLMLYKEDVLWS